MRALIPRFACITAAHPDRQPSALRPLFMDGLEASMTTFQIADVTKKVVDDHLIQAGRSNARGFDRNKTPGSCYMSHCPVADASIAL
jgi:hypothetical protein